MKNSQAPETSGAARDNARRLYQSSRDGASSEAGAAPTAVALRLYTQALDRDPKNTLPYLRMRLYLLRLAFDPAGARPLLEELKRTEPRNAAVPLEEARQAFLIDDNPQQGAAYLREAARLPELSRSYLVAAPEPLRRSLTFARGLRDWIGRGWPSYGWLVSTLYRIQTLQKDPGPQTEVRLLRLALDEPLCKAPDYVDQRAGINDKSQVLGELAALGESGLLPPEQRALVAQLQRQHRQTFADFPRARHTAVLTMDGLVLQESPALEPEQDGAPEGPHLLLSVLGGGLLGFRHAAGGTQ
jgi:hypothetical protein